MNIYFDNAATTQTDKKVVEKMLPFFGEKYGNTSSIHAFGSEALFAVDKARKQVADFLNCNPEEIIFTSSATESNNTILKTIPNIIRGKYPKKNKIVISSVEHHCVLDSAKSMKDNGFEIVMLPIDKEGIVDIKKAKSLINDEVALVSVMYANNEIGTIMPIRELADLAHKNGALFHTDAVQAINYLDCDVKKLDVDFLSLSAHKFYGPKGTGALYHRSGIKITPYLHGGAQEFNYRAGTLNTPGIVGLGEAIAMAKKERNKRYSHAQALKNKLFQSLKKELGDDIRLNGSNEKRLPNNLNISFSKVEGEGMLLGLDLEGVAASTGSACSSMSLEPSHVLMALYNDPLKAHGSIRFSFGKYNTLAEVKRASKIIAKVYKRLRALSPL